MLNREREVKMKESSKTLAIEHGRPLNFSRLYTEGSQLHFCPGENISVQCGSYSQSDSSFQIRSLKSLLSMQQKVYHMGRRPRVPLR